MLYYAYLNKAGHEAAEVRMRTPTHVHVIAQPAIVRRFSSFVKSALFRRKVEVRTKKLYGGRISGHDIVFP